MQGAGSKAEKVDTEPQSHPPPLSDPTLLPPLLAQAALLGVSTTPTLVLHLSSWNHRQNQL